MTPFRWLHARSSTICSITTFRLAFDDRGDCERLLLSTGFIFDTTGLRENHRFIWRRGKKNRPPTHICCRLRFLANSNGMCHLISTNTTTSSPILKMKKMSEKLASFISADCQVWAVWRFFIAYQISCDPPSCWNGRGYWISGRFLEISCSSLAFDKKFSCRSVHLLIGL